MLCRRRSAFLLFAIAASGCGPGAVVDRAPQPLTPTQAASVESSVRAFAKTVATDVTQQGPSVWRKHFADSPAFFMAVNGNLAFPNSAAATAAIRNLTHSIKRIELHWGDDLRVDPLTLNLAVMAASYHELQTGADGKQVSDAGFFTGTTEYRDGRWQFRNAHWSSAAPPSSIR